jgi:hypothetical protein
MFGGVGDDKAVAIGTKTPGVRVTGPGGEALGTRDDANLGEVYRAAS